jgi:hypothetical protein
MKTITNLTGSVIETNYREPRGILQVVHLEPSAGVHVRISLGGAGVVFTRGKTSVAYPLAELSRLVFEQCPELIELAADAAAAAEKAANPFSAAKRILDQPNPIDVKRDAV